MRWAPPLPGEAMVPVLIDPTGSALGSGWHIIYRGDRLTLPGAPTRRDALRSPVGIPAAVVYVNHKGQIFGPVRSSQEGGP